MLNAVYRSFIQNEPDRYSPINAQFQLVRFDIDFDALYLLTDRAAQSADIIGKFDSSTILSGCELIMRKRNRIDSACDDEPPRLNSDVSEWKSKPEQVESCF